MLDKSILVTAILDVVSILIFAGLFYYRRYRRRDLFVTFTFFNIAMFVIVTLIADAKLGIGASFGLFALLSIIRLRSEEFSNLEVGYFFGGLTIAIINGLSGNHYGLALAMDGGLLVAIALLDSPLLMKNVLHSKVSLDAVYTDDAELTKALSILLNAKILNYTVTKVDNVNDVTNVSVGYRKNAQPALRENLIGHSKVSLDAVYTDDLKIRKVLTKLLNATILEYTITKIDNVRDITNVSVVYRRDIQNAPTRVSQETKQRI